MNGFDTYDDIIAKLGKYKLGKGCLYIKSLSDVDATILAELIKRSYRDMKDANS